MTGRAFIAAAVVALLVAPGWSRGNDEPDRHEPNRHGEVTMRSCDGAVLWTFTDGTQVTTDGNTIRVPDGLILENCECLPDTTTTTTVRTTTSQPGTSTSLTTTTQATTTTLTPVTSSSVPSTTASPSSTLPPVTTTPPTSSVPPTTTTPPTTTVTPTTVVATTTTTVSPTPTTTSAPPTTTEELPRTGPLEDLSKIAAAGLVLLGVGWRMTRIGKERTE